MENNLTKFQQNLIDGLIKEFTKINPKPTSSSKRFSVNTIAECNNEEARFVQTMTKHNLTMLKVYTSQFNNEIKDFKKEYGKVLGVQIGQNLNTAEYGPNHEPRNTYDAWVKINEANDSCFNTREFYEMYLCLVSKTKILNRYDDNHKYNYCYGRDFCTIYVDFKRERVVHTLESGKEITTYKIIGLEYRTREYLHKKNGEISDTLDGLIQTSKDIQKRIVYLAS